MVGLGQKGFARVWRNSLKYLKRGWNRKEGKGNKDFKKGGKLDQRVGALKRGGWNLLTNYGNMLQTLERRRKYIGIILSDEHTLWSNVT